MWSVCFLGATAPRSFLQRSCSICPVSLYTISCIWGVPSTDLFFLSEDLRSLGFYRSQVLSGLSASPVWCHARTHADRDGQTGRPAWPEPDEVRPVLDLVRQS